MSGIDKRWLVDGFGEPFRLVKKNRKDTKESVTVFDDYDVVSTGPSRKLGGKDNMNIAEAMNQTNRFGWMGGTWWADDRQERFAGELGAMRGLGRRDADMLMLNRAAMPM